MVEHLLTNPGTLRLQRQMIRSGQLAGRQLADTLHPLISLPSRKVVAEVLSANQFFLHAMAFHPTHEGRQLALALAQQFSQAVQVNADMFSAAMGEEERLAVLTTPLPFSPVQKFGGQAYAGWIRDIIPDMDIDWLQTHDTLLKVAKMGVAKLQFILKLEDWGIIKGSATPYTARNNFANIGGAVRTAVPGNSYSSDLEAIFAAVREKGKDVSDPMLRFVLKGTKPDYSSMQVPEGSKPSPEQVQTALRLAFLARNRWVSIPSHQYEQDLLCYPPPSEVIQKSGSEGETIFLLKYPSDKSWYSLFIKNDWPIGYGIATPEEESLSTLDHRVRRNAPQSYIRLGFHIFKEYRGAESSAKIFQLFLAATHERLQKDCFIVETDLEGQKAKAQGIAWENQAKVLNFYLNQGFTWLENWGNFINLHNPMQYLIYMWRK